MMLWRHKFEAASPENNLHRKSLKAQTLLFDYLLPSTSLTFNKNSITARSNNGNDSSGAVFERSRTKQLDAPSSRHYLHWW